MVGRRAKQIQDVPRALPEHLDSYHSVSPVTCSANEAGDSGTSAERPMSIGRLVRLRRRRVLRRIRIDDAVGLAAHHIILDGDEREQREWNLRGSSILSSCVRRAVLCRIHERVTKDKLNPQLYATFLIGDAVHKLIQNTPSLFGSNRRGLWKCLACKRTRFGPPQTKRCFCGADPEAYVYEEYTITNIDGHEVGGHPDLFIIDSEQMLRIVELKTISLKQYNNLFAPHADHRAQLQTYLWAAKTDLTLRRWGVDSEAGYVVYVAKEYVFKDFPYKMYRHTWDDTIQSMITKRVEMYDTGLNGTLPAKHKECKSIKSYRARTCPVKRECFYGKPTGKARKNPRKAQGKASEAKAGTKAGDGR